MKRNVTQKLIESRLAHGSLTPGEPIALRIDQTLTQDATGTLVMLEFEAMQVPRVKTELSAQYVDHNLLQEDFRNPDDHLFLRSACRKYGIRFSPPGNGVSHPVHMERFGRPGRTLLGSDSHTPAAGSLGMLAIGAGGLEVAMAMAGEPYRLAMPKVLGIRLTGKLPPWTSAKDIILEMLRRHGVRGGVGKIIEYFGDGLDGLTAMDRHVIANMGAELGATTTVFPADGAVKAFLQQQSRAEEFDELVADDGCSYDDNDTIDLSEIEPLIAKPSSPGNVVPVSDVEGEPIYQAYIGSSANPGYRDFAIAAEIVDGRPIAPGVSFDVNPSTRQILTMLTESGALGKLIQTGARIHQAGCNGCIGMGQAPATERNSLRTVPRNFPGRSGTKEDRVWLCSPETAAVSALRGQITDPRRADCPYPNITIPAPTFSSASLIEAPADDPESVTIERGPNIKPLPEFEPVTGSFEAPVLVKAGNDVSTDEILPAGSRVLPHRSNVPAISHFAFEGVDPDYYHRAMENAQRVHLAIGGSNYGQGSSREHAAVAPRFLGLGLVIAKSFARIHRANLINVGIVPLTFAEPSDYDRLSVGSKLRVESRPDLKSVTVHDIEQDRPIPVNCELSQREWDLVETGGLVNWIRLQHAA